MANNELNVTKFLRLLKGVDGAYFDYKQYLNDNWDKVDENVKIIYDRDNNVYVGELTLETKDDYSAIMAALQKATLEKKTLVFPNGIYRVPNLDITSFNVDVVFEKGTVIVGNVKIYNISDVSFTNLKIEGNLTLESIENCKFINAEVQGNTLIGTSGKGHNKSNYFINSKFNSPNRAVEFYCTNQLAESSNAYLEVSYNTFTNCQITGSSNGIYSNILENVTNAEISHNLFVNCKTDATNLSIDTNSAIYLGRNTKAFHFIEQRASGYNSVDAEKSGGLHVFTGGLLNGEIKGTDKFLIYKPAVSNTVSFDKMGNNINNMRKMKVFKNEVPKWTKFNVDVENASNIVDITGDTCLKIISPDNASFPTLERTFRANDHLNQPINVIARVRVIPNKYSTDAALILTNGVSSNTVTVPIKPDNKWKIVAAKIENTTNKDIVVKLSPNNSYIKSDNTLYVDWIIITLGDFAQFSSIPTEEHHYRDLEHYGNFTVYGDSKVEGNLSVGGNLALTGNIMNDMTIKNGNLSLMKDSSMENNKTSINIGNETINSANSSVFKFFRINIEGTDNNQSLKIYSVTGQKSGNNYIETVEEMLKISHDSITFKDQELYNDNNFGGAGFQRPENPKIGRMFYDISLRQPIWFDGFDWRDADKNKV